jgi:hypothetical protein
MDQQNLRVLFMTAILFFHASLPAPAIHFIFLLTKGCLVLGHSSPRRPLQYFIIHSWQDKLTRKQWREREREECLHWLARNQLAVEIMPAEHTHATMTFP